MGLLVLSGYYSSDSIRYAHAPTLSLPVDSTLYFIVDFKDDISNDTLVQTRSQEGYPISYSRSIRTGVCFDNKCRPLDITLRWNLTGRYLGFELPEKEFLSKYDHDPFSEAEYQRLHAILTDSLSPLANFHYNEIVPKADSTYEKVDAVSGATSASVLEHVVEGAAFTTYKLWHLVYGPARQQVEALTSRALTPELIQLVLNSTHPSDKIWALNHIDGYVKPTPALQKVVVSFISDQDYNLTERALNSINSNDLQSGALQSILVQKIFETKYSTQKLLLTKLKAVPKLHKEAYSLLNQNLTKLNGQLIAEILQLFIQYQISDVETYRSVSALLASPNAFVSGKAYAFLTRADPQDVVVKERLTVYEEKHKGKAIE